MERFRQFARADVCGSRENDELLRFTILIARDRCLNGVDLKHRRHRWDPQFFFDCVPRLRTALRGPDTFRHSELEKILLVRQHDRGAVYVRNALMQPVGDREMRRWIVSRENV